MTAAALDPVTSTATTATYQVTSPYTLQLSGTGPCWMEATDSQTGQVLWTGTLVAGGSQSVPSTAGMLLRLGDAANVTLAVGDQPVDLPPGHAATMEISFVTG